jgi:glycosyltransferase involved in cell wall biosynthesis
MKKNKNINIIDKIIKKISNANNTNKTICLNMIVKNEAHIILETLSNIIKYIDYWVISDTGSTDRTQEIIKKFFADKNIPGELFQHEWKNFGHNRTMALECAYNKTDYVFIMDADDIIQGDITFPTSMISDSYKFKFGTNFVYYRPLLFSNRLKWCFKGVLHEYAYCLDKKNTISDNISDTCYIESRRLGSRSKDPDKYLKDATILVKAIEDNE